MRVMLTEPAFLILTALVGEARHGYGILGEVVELSRRVASTASRFGSRTGKRCGMAGSGGTTG